MMDYKLDEAVLCDNIDCKSKEKIYRNHRVLCVLVSFVPFVFESLIVYE